MATIEHGFNMARVRELLDSEDWESDDALGGDQVRRLYLGTVFQLTPSGKYYMPFACSNVMGCATCHGTGKVFPRSLKRRTHKKMLARHARVMRKFDALYGDAPATYAGSDSDTRPGMPSLVKAWRPTNKRAAFAFIDRQPAAYRLRYLGIGAQCLACGGNGSREAHLDELWREKAEKAFEDLGISLEAGDGDPCDLFACEYRDAPDDDEDGNEDEPHDPPGYGVWNGE